MSIVNYLIAGGLGALLATAELFSRYRDKPLRLVKRGAAWIYLAVNASASLAALLLIDKFGWDFGQTGQGQRTAQVLVAGLGAAVLFRSSLFIFKVGDDNVGVGPSLILNSLLGAADRSVDRDQAAVRLEVGGAAAGLIDFSKAKEALVTACLAATANVPAEEAADLRKSVQALESTVMSDGSKALVLCLLIIDVVGAEVLAAAINQLGAQILRPSTP